MNGPKRTVPVKCHNCGKTFPVAATTSREEEQQAEAILKGGGDTLRVARWCPFCQSTNMLDLTAEQIEIVETETVFRRDLKAMAGGAPGEGEAIG